MNFTLGNHIQDFLSYCRQKGHSRNTLLAYKNSLRTFEQFALARKVTTVEAVTRALLRDYADHLSEIMKPGGAHARLRPLKTFFTWLEADEVIPKSPMTRVALPKLPRKILPAVGTDDMQRLMAAAQMSKNPLRDRAILAVLFDTGVRASELCGLCLADVQPGGRLEVQAAKGGRSRIVPISRVGMRHLSRYIQSERPQSRLDTLFLTTPQAGMTRYTVSQLLERLCHAANIQQFSAHCFRRGFAVNYLRNEGDVFTLQRILGHATLEMTNRYAVLVTEDLKDVHRRASPLSTLSEWR